MSGVYDSLFFSGKNNVPAEIANVFIDIGSHGSLYFNSIDKIKELADRHYENLECMENDKEELFEKMLVGTSQEDQDIMRNTEVYCRDNYKSTEQNIEMKKRAIIRAKLNRIWKDLCRKVFPLNFISSPEKVATPKKKTPSKRYLYIYFDTF
jgi:hypothetical protein